MNIFFQYILLPLIPAAFLYLALVMPLEFLRSTVSTRTKRTLFVMALATSYVLLFAVFDVQISQATGSSAPAAQTLSDRIPQPTPLRDAA